MANYNASTVGVPYVRVNNININYLPDMKAHVTFNQVMAVELADGSVVELGSTPIPNATFALDMVSEINNSYPLVDNVTGANLGASMTLGQVLVGVLAIIRQNQLTING